FHTYGDLSKAYSDINDNHTKILMSHTPAHWHTDIRNTDCKVDLTLSGHTHGMQFEIFGWSPIAFRYDEWSGLYIDERNHQIYVNIGLGTVGFPARIGATPEITLITLKNEK
ncbi:MAG: metallophosphoesterase, partial [Muribaculaceae bacterium]|nr:metallophosphoesterase [Muribaculaceae bacterium]